MINIWSNHNIYFFQWVYQFILGNSTCNLIILHIQYFQVLIVLQNSKYQFTTFFSKLIVWNNQSFNLGITQSFTNISESLIPKFIVTQIQIFNSIGCMFFYKLADLWHMIIRQIYNKKSIKKNNLLFDDKSTSPVRACYLKYSVRLNFPSFTTLIGTKSFLSPDKFYKLGLFLINYFLTSSCLLFKSIWSSSGFGLLFDLLLSDNTSFEGI